MRIKKNKQHFIIMIMTLTNMWRINKNVDYMNDRIDDA